MPRVPGPHCSLTKPLFIKDGSLALTATPTPRHATQPVRPRSTQTAFVGCTALAEARSLLRPCLPHGGYGKPLPVLPSFLEEILGKVPKIGASLMQGFLRRNETDEADLGGPLTVDVPKARYFVIHDTSSPLNVRETSFPSNMNDSTWRLNRRSDLIARHNAHVFIARTGLSSTAFDFAIPFSSTKFTDGRTSTGYAARLPMFCHIEMIQPRLMHGSSDWEAPKPGFPAVQIERLALVYIAASVRHGEWLIPAYHHNVDMGSESYHPQHKGPHDDPQNFDLSEWVDAIEDLQKQMIGAPRPGGDFPIGGAGPVQG